MRIFQNNLSIAGSTYPQPVDVFILTGQSNAQGTGLNSEATAGEVSKNFNTRIYNTSTNAFEPLEIGVNNLASALARHGLELGLALYTQKPIYIIKWAVSGTCISEHLTGGSVYNNLFPNYVTEGINQLIDYGKIPRVSLIYAQGECDSNTQVNTDAYSANFDAWVSLWQGHFGTDLPIYAVEIIETEARDAQINQVFASKALTEPNMTVIDTADWTSDDDLHYDYDYLKNIASRIVTAEQSKRGVSVTQQL